MIEMDFNHCQNVRGALAGEKTVDEKTFASIAVLNDRLQKIQKLGKNFSKIGFSSSVKNIAKQEKPVALC